MRGLVRKTILAAAIAGSGIFLAAGAQAHDDDHGRDEQWRREHRQYVEEHEHWRHEPPRTVVYERPPVIVAPAPIMVAPAPVYVPAMPSSLNLNFSLPLR
jgi:hypothetical protein